jgi:hypothetical protein
LEIIPFDEVFEIVDFENSSAYYTFAMKHLIEKRVPNTTRRVRKLSPDEWLTNDIIALIRQRNYMRKKFLKAKKLGNNYINFWSQHKRLRNDVVVKLRNSKCNVITKKLSSLRDKPKEFWLELNTSANKKKFESK